MGREQEGEIIAIDEKLSVVLRKAKRYRKEDVCLALVPKMPFIGGGPIISW